MNAHVADDLPRLLSGEADRDDVLDAALHLRTCVDCQQELVSAVVAHASLSSAHRFAPEIVASPSVDAAQGAAGPLPDLSAVFAQVREEAASPVRRPAARRSRMLLGAAAAVAVIGTGTGLLVANLGGDQQPSGQTVRLAAYDEGTTGAQAVLTDGQLRIDASALPRLSGKGYEVWLTDSAGDMQPVGWIGTDGTATIRVPQKLMDRYSNIQVSVQDMGAPSYLFSDVSVLRGAYT